MCAGKSEFFDIYTSHSHTPRPHRRADARDRSATVTSVVTRLTRAPLRRHHAPARTTLVARGSTEAARRSGVGDFQGRDTDSRAKREQGRGGRRGGRGHKYYTLDGRRTTYTRRLRTKTYTARLLTLATTD